MNELGNLKWVGTLSAVCKALKQVILLYTKDGLELATCYSVIQLFKIVITICSLYSIIALEASVILVKVLILWCVSWSVCLENSEGKRQRWVKIRLACICIGVTIMYLCMCMYMRACWIIYMVNPIASEFIHKLLNMFTLARFHLGFGNILVVNNRWHKVALK